MAQFLECINIVKHLQKYVILKKVEGHHQNRKVLQVFLGDLLLAVFLLVIIFTVSLIKMIMPLQVGGLVLGLALLAYLGVRVFFTVTRPPQTYDGAKRLVLQDEEGKNIRAWPLERRKALILGKKTRDNEVDIDLSEAQYATLISKQHAVLNYSDHNWYLEDIGSSNGTGVKRSNAKHKFKLEPGRPYPINSGDIILIANTQLLVK